MRRDDRGGAANGLPVEAATSARERGSETMIRLFRSKATAAVVSRIMGEGPAVKASVMPVT
ncbi:hypothetical protein GCM10022286_21550 [Gryllotalpicola daejeonensis]|uniref:Uncharacterized protein n=1 Tax=Gryllotalpicola daejeonensis TaxID=993087 RepID=A0ABP7ZL46_9MICO